MAKQPTVPDNFDDAARDEWNRICEACTKMKRRFRDGDRPLLETYVKTWLIHRTAYEKIQNSGSVIEGAKGQVTSPHYKVYKETTLLLRGLLADLGCTPASRDFDVPVKKPAEREGKLKF